MYRSFSDRIKKYIKLRLATPSIKNTIPHKTKNCNRAIMIGSPVHSNMGDQLIARECRRYIEGLGFEEVVEVPEFTYELFASKVKIAPTDTIFICGGGWMGDLYEDELVVEEILSKWRTNRIVILPQTVYYKGEGISSIEQLRIIISRCEDLYICVRDELSYNVCISRLGIEKSKCFLLPDMALLALKEIKSNPKKTNKILLSLREDAEKSSDIDRLMLNGLADSKGYKCVNTSTVINRLGVGITRRERTIQEVIEEFSEAELLITDRLHSMVFSLLSGTKCIAIDNLTHKVKGVGEKWLSNYPGLKICNDGNELTLALVEEMLLSSDTPEPIDFTHEMLPLTELIRSQQNE